LNIEPFMYLSHGESKDQNSKARQSILANAIEAIIGALYLDKDYDTAATFIHKNMIAKLPHILKYKLYMDAKSRFQEEAQEKVNITPSYRVLSESGPDHAKNFVIGVYLENQKIAEGAGTSKQEAQTQAAEQALKTKGWLEPTK